MFEQVRRLLNCAFPAIFLALVFDLFRRHVFGSAQGGGFHASFPATSARRFEQWTGAAAQVFSYDGGPLFLSTDKLQDVRMTQLAPNLVSR